MVFSDIFRSHDMGGWAKALWVIFVIILPFLGVLVYLIARGGKMQRAATSRTRGTRSEAFDAYVQARPRVDRSRADELAKLADLTRQGCS